jgi:hypothetical protein
LQNNDPKSENKALKERAAKTKDLQARRQNTSKEHERARKSAAMNALSKTEKRKS